MRHGGSCEHVFVTAQGSTYSQFKRAIRRRNFLDAWTLAAELPQMPLADALALLLLARDADPERYARCGALALTTLRRRRPPTRREPANTRCAQRAQRPRAQSGARALLVVFDRYGLRGEAKVLEAWLAQMGGEDSRAAT